MAVWHWSLGAGQSDAGSSQAPPPVPELEVEVEVEVDVGLDAPSPPVPVPLNYRLAPPEWVYILQDAQVNMLIAAEEYLPAIASIRGELTHVTHYIAFTEHPPGGWSSPGRKHGLSLVLSAGTPRSADP